MKLNSKSSISKSLNNHPNRTTNFEGGLAFTASPKLELMTRVCTWMVNEPKFYGHVAAETGRIIELIQQVGETDPSFILKLAVYARENLNLRTAPLVLLVESALLNQGEPKTIVKDATPRIVTRADQLAETIAYLQSRIGHIGNHATIGSCPAALKKGLSIAFNNFNEYQFAKYNRKNEVKLRDVLRIVHPKPKNEKQSELFKKILTDTLATPDTWEVIISTQGSTKETWTKARDVMPIMATIRNLRNMLENDVDMKPVIEKLTNPEIIRKSKQFPYRFYSAYRELDVVSNRQTAKVQDALVKALEISCENIPHFTGTTYICGDTSSSMDSPVSENSTVWRSHIAFLLQAIASRFCDDVICSVFGAENRFVTMPKSSSIFDNLRKAERTEAGHSTNAWLCINDILKNKTHVDRIIIFSDMQCYDSHSYYGAESLAAMLKKYRATVNPDCYMYSVDLAGYGTLQIPEDDPKTMVMAGWSEKLLNFIPVFESDRKTMLDAIESVQIKGGTD